jgi:hypothetical protein
VAAVIVVYTRTKGPNSREHWRVKAKRVASERNSTSYALMGEQKPPIPCSVRLTRVGPGMLDDDNLVGAMKGVRDEIAKWLGIDDRHSETVRYVYAQRRASVEWIVTVEFGAPVAGAQFNLLEQA